MFRHNSIYSTNWGSRILQKPKCTSLSCLHSVPFLFKKKHLICFTSVSFSKHKLFYFFELDPGSKAEDRDSPLFFQISIDVLFILTLRCVFISRSRPSPLPFQPEWFIEMHILFAIDYIHDLLKAFCSVPVMSAGLQTGFRLNWNSQRSRRVLGCLIKPTAGRIACRFMNKKHVFFW